LPLVPQRVAEHHVIERDRRLVNQLDAHGLLAKDCGCTKPGCTVPGYGCPAYHAEKDWAERGLTNIDDLALACPPHNRLVESGGSTTRKRKDGTTEWIPPPHLDSGQARTNHYHHPEKYLTEPDNGAA
jgi:hypothetical protein